MLKKILFKPNDCMFCTCMFCLSPSYEAPLYKTLLSSIIVFCPPHYGDFPSYVAIFWGSWSGLKRWRNCIFTCDQSSLLKNYQITVHSFQGVFGQKRCQQNYNKIILLCYKLKYNRSFLIKYHSPWFQIISVIHLLHWA